MSSIDRISTECKSAFAVARVFVCACPLGGELVSTAFSGGSLAAPRPGDGAVPEPENQESYFSNAHWKKTYRHAQTVVNNPADAEDIAQEAFLRLYSAVTGGKKIDSLAAWMKSVVRRVAVDHFRKTRPDLHVALVDGGEDDNSQSRLITDLPDLTTSTEDRLAAHSVLRESLRILAEIPERDRECVMMYARGYTFVQIASVLNIPYETAIKTTRKALVKTRRRIARRRQP